MQNWELLLIAIGLSFDTFAVSVSTGLTVSHIKFWQAIRIAIVLAIFQSFMPLLGWLGGTQIERYISNYDHWIAFGLLSILGIKMTVETFKNTEEKKFNPLLLSVLVVMAIATSIDALVVGISFALLNTNIYFAISIIGSVTFLVSMIGMSLGKNVNGKFGKKAQIIGGLILIGIGLKILLSHLL
jgi:manganese efflux pump family protein